MYERVGEKHWTRTWTGCVGGVERELVFRDFGRKSNDIESGSSLEVSVGIVRLELPLACTAAVRAAGALYGVTKAETKPTKQRSQH